MTTFYNIFQNHSAKFNLIWHKGSLGKGKFSKIEGAAFLQGE